MTDCIFPIPCRILETAMNLTLNTDLIENVIYDEITVAKARVCCVH